MTFRTRILLACLAAAIIPLVLLAAGARHAVRQRLTDQFRERVAQSSESARRELAATAVTIDDRLRVLERGIAEDPDTRAALLDPGRRSALIDFAPDAMTAAGLDFLLLLDETETVLSSGHFRNDYDRSLPGLIEAIPATAPTLVSALSPTGELLALVRSSEFTLGGRRFVLVAGVAVDSTFVARLAGADAGALVVSLTHPGGALSSGRLPAGSGVIAEHVAMPYVDATGSATVAGEARWTISHSVEPLRAITRGMDLWFVAALAAGALLAIVMSRILAARVNRPLEELARRASRVELARYDVGLATRRTDEIGSLSRLLDRMVQRLRTSALQLRDAERRATIGDMARQVNHDIRNGLLPIRNVIRHLAEVAAESPATLGGIFHERAGTLEAGIGYLENLATNYARLTPRAERRPCDVNEIVRTVVRESALPGADRIELELEMPLSQVSADAVALRRVIENLTINALESPHDDGGSVVIRSRNAGTDTAPRVVIDVIDTGSGMPPETVAHIFDDFYTTKERGTGLGLSIVRRLVADMGGRIDVESQPGRGTTFTIELPALP